MAKQKVSAMEAQAPDSPELSLTLGITSSEEDLSKQRASFEASIDALVDVQLIRLAEVLLFETCMFVQQRPILCLLR